MTKTSHETKRFIEYARVSKIGERDVDDLKSPEIQMRAMDRYAKQNGIEIIDRVVDLDESGRSFEKRAIRSITDRIRAGEADGILVWKWSRWGRNVEQAQVYLRRVKNAGGQVIAVTNDIDQSTAIGQFQLTLQHGIDQLESDQISEGWKAVKTMRVERGLTSGGKPPFGYVDAGKGKPFAPDEATADVVREMYARYISDEGYQRITHWLNVQGVNTTRGNAWRLVTLQRYMDSGFAAGYRSMHDPECVKHKCELDHEHTVRCCEGRVLLKGGHEPLIDEQTWETYKHLRNERRQVRPKARVAHWYLARGLTVCGLCGSNMTVNSYASPKSQVLCSAYKTRRTCKGVWMNRVDLEAIADEWLEHHLTEWASQQDQFAGIEDERAQLTRRLNDAKAVESRLDDGRRRAARMVMLGTMTEEEHDAALRETQAERDAVRARVADLQSQLDALDPDVDVLDRLERNMITEPQELNVVMKRLLRKITVSKDEVTIEPWRGPTWIYDRTTIAPRERSTWPKRGDGGRFIR